jgi:hypothetical protein
MIHTCSVSDCEAPASVKVFLYDVYSDGEVFEEQDITCPYLCEAHRAENESSASGERRPRGITLYKFSNQNGAQGYTIYKPVTD